MQIAGMILGAHSRLDKIFGDVFEVYAIKIQGYAIKVETDVSLC
ncbi:hypothetical protein ACTQWG_04520 [Blautia sp. HCP3S3_H10_1]